MYYQTFRRINSAVCELRSLDIVASLQAFRGLPDRNTSASLIRHLGQLDHISSCPHERLIVLSGSCGLGLSCDVGDSLLSIVHINRDVRVEIVQSVAQNLLPNRAIWLCGESFGNA